MTAKTSSRAMRRRRSGKSEPRRVRPTATPADSALLDAAGLSADVATDERDAEIRRLNRELEIATGLLGELRRDRVAQAEKLAAAGELIAGIAHEINNPLAVVLGYLRILINEMGPSDWSVRMEMEHIVEHVCRVQRIIDSLLHIARPSRVMETLAAEDLHTLVTDSLQVGLHQVQRGELNVLTDLRATAPVTIGRQDLQQIVVNLLVNAMHAVEGHGGSIEVGSRDWEGRGVMLSVRDSGPGVPPELVDKIFRPFFTTKPLGKGTGLGLSVSIGLIRRYGGHLTLESSANRGAEFRLWILTHPVVDEEDDWLAQTLLSGLETRTRVCPMADNGDAARTHRSARPGSP